MFTFVTARTLRFPPYRGIFLKCFRPFVASWPAPSASGRSESGRTGISPVGLVCLCQGTHNNFVERQIKQYALGRKLWLFCYDKVGAQASANLFSLVMTARANGLEPFEYLSEVFEQLPLATTVEAIEALLPWNLKPILDARRKSQQSAPR
jgi:transposase IS66-like protein/transposase IS66 family protein